MSNYLTIKEVAQILQVKPGTIYRNGPQQYGGIKIGGLWRFPADKVGTCPEPKPKNNGGYVRRFGKNKGMVV